MKIRHINNVFISPWFFIVITIKAGAHRHFMPLPKAINENQFTVMWKQPCFTSYLT